ncbi:unnamed protein product [Polarella glacialis]|uniref:Protein kinase domain-containing protein n=1 Tax=Polarella glacialis TaxID=89957 RepID=A0A813GIM7_POLGL|nr:unnamed protein product [Polarella glacialis]
MMEPAKLELAIVLEFVQGPSLHKFVVPDAGVEPGLPNSDRHQLLLGIAAALWYLHKHQQPIVHGDLKPANIIVEGGSMEHLKPKLLDFGLSRILGSRPKVLGGTVRWMAPEIICNASTPPTSAADVFSFGRLAFFTTMGVIPLDSRMLSDPSSRPDMGAVFKELKSWESILQTRAGPMSAGAAKLLKEGLMRTVSLPNSSGVSPKISQLETRFGKSLQDSTIDATELKQQQTCLQSQQSKSMSAGWNSDAVSEMDECSNGLTTIQASASSDLPTSSEVFFCEDEDEDLEAGGDLRDGKESL